MSKLPLELEFKGTMELTDLFSSFYVSSPHGNETHQCSAVLDFLRVNVKMSAQGTACEYDILSRKAFELFVRFYFVVFFF